MNGSRRRNSGLLKELSDSGKSVSLVVEGRRPIQGKVEYHDGNYYLVGDSGRRLKTLYVKDVVPGVHGKDLAFSVVGVNDSSRKVKRVVSSTKYKI